MKTTTRLALALLLLAACGETQLERFETTLTITSSSLVAADDALYAATKIAAAEIVAKASSPAAGEAAVVKLEKAVADVHAALTIAKGLIVVGLSIAAAVKGSGASSLIDAWLPTLWAALAEVNKALAALSDAGVKVPAIATGASPGGVS